MNTLNAYSMVSYLTDGNLICPVPVLTDSMSTVKKSCLRHETTGEKLSHSPPG